MENTILELLATKKHIETLLFTHQEDFTIYEHIEYSDLLQEIEMELQSVKG